MSYQKRKNVRILIVDDAVLNQEIICDYIEDLGFSYDTVDNGQQAVDATQSIKYHLICMDIHMPVMDGLDATRAIRDYEVALGNKPTPIIALSSDKSSELKRHCFEAGMDDFLLKPFSQQQLLEKIDPILESENISCLEFLEQTTDAPEGKSNLHSEVEMISQVSHWFWGITNQKFEFSKHLQLYLNFSLSDINSLDDYITNIGDDDMKAAVEECLTSNAETRWEQTVPVANSDKPNQYLHKFRTVTCEDGNLVLVGTIQDISSIRLAEQQILELASYDSTTCLSSRFWFNQQLQDLINDSQRHNKKFAVLNFNLNALNSFQHAIENKTKKALLLNIADRLRKVLRKSDIACRLIDDEFCLVLKDISDEFIVMKIAERYLKLFETPVETPVETSIETPDETNKISVMINANIGISIFPQDGNDVSTLVNAAEKAAEKSAYTDDCQIAFYVSTMNEEVKNRIRIDNEMRCALDENQFELFYQPTISLATGNVVSIEAMIRWHHPDKNLLLPESFLPDAAFMNTILDIDHWVIRALCEQINIWSQQGLEDLHVSINISQQMFLHEDFSDTINQLVTDAGISPSVIEIEITESTSRFQKVFNDTCKKLHSYGFTTAIDDFGTGYSSISSLKELPIDTLKIDHEFICNLPHDTQSSIIIGTILGISHALDLQVVAEGVENSEQLKSLTAMGCHMAQGFYFSRPVPAADIPALIRHNFKKDNIHLVA